MIPEGSTLLEKIVLSLIGVVPVVVTQVILFIVKFRRDAKWRKEDELKRIDKPQVAIKIDNLNIKIH